MKNEIRFTLKSRQRPKLAQEIGNILGTAPHYERKGQTTRLSLNPFLVHT